jgi:CO/xanthine dehydrogenase Mo-binding subunit
MKKRGIGFACSAQGANYHFGHEDKATAELRVLPDDTLLIRSAASDLGQGLEAVLVNIASLALDGYPADRIRWEGSNTGAPEAGGTGASRQSTVTGNALYQACENLKELMRPVAAELLNCPPADIRFEGGTMGGGGAAIPLHEVFQAAREMGMALAVQGSYTAPRTTELSPDGKGFPVNQFGYGAHIAEVEVDTVTGEVAVLEVRAFHDAGTVLNPIGAAAQVEGATVMGMGFALFEDYLLSQGKPVNAGFTNYIIPSVSDMPQIDVHFLDYPATFGRLGVKGLAEAPTTTIAPAIINAICEATGVRITHLPATPERVLDALDRKEGAE